MSRAVRSRTLTAYRIEIEKKVYTIAAEPASRVGERLRHGIPYEHKLLYHILQTGYKGVAVDVGAHIGNHALFLAAICGLDVVAFEPVFYHELCENVIMNRHVSIRAERYALGSAEGWAIPVGAVAQRAPDTWGEIELQHAPRGTLKASAYNTPTGYPLRTLDSFQLENVCLIKIDVEGMETAVLEGSVETIARCRPDLYIEARDERAHSDIEAVLWPMLYEHVLTANTSTPVELWQARR